MLPDLWTLHEKFFNYIKALAKMILGLTTRFVQTCPIFEPAQCETSCIVNYRLGDKVSLCPPCAPLQTISMFMIVLVTAGVYRKVTWNTWSKSRVLWLLNRFFFVCVEHDESLTTDMMDGWDGREIITKGKTAQQALTWHLTWHLYCIYRLQTNN